MTIQHTARIVNFDDIKKRSNLYLKLSKNGISLWINIE